LRWLFRIAVAGWLGRWLAYELAAHAGRRWLPPGPPPVESARAPGWMPGPERGMVDTPDRPDSGSA
jgi:hypothetical protein